MHSGAKNDWDPIVFDMSADPCPVLFAEYVDRSALHVMPRLARQQAVLIGLHMKVNAAHAIIRSIVIMKQP